MRKNFVVLLLLGIRGFASFAQTFDTYQIWTRVMVRKQIHKWDFSADFNYRRQNNYLMYSFNPLAFPQTTLLRATVGYQAGHNLTLLLVPFLYADHYRLRYNPVQSTEVEAVSQREFRWAGGIQKMFKINKLQLKPRFIVEYRYFPESTSRLRERLQVLAQYPVWERAERKLYALAFDELFYTSTATDNVVYEQNRSFLGIYYQTGKLLEYQIGYQYTYQKQAQTIFHQSAALVYVIFRL